MMNHPGEDKVLNIINKKGSLEKFLDFLKENKDNSEYRRMKNEINLMSDQLFLFQILEGYKI